jgi:hypothetical protein
MMTSKHKVIDLINAPTANRQINENPEIWSLEAEQIYEKQCNSFVIKLIRYGRVQTKSRPVCEKGE